MVFWIILFAVIYVIANCELLKNKHKIIANNILIIVIFTVVAFRYMVGWDYYSYMILYDDVDEDRLYLEKSFKYLCIVLRQCGFDYQIVFFIYALITMFFAYIASKKFNVDTPLFWGLYALYPMGMLNSMGQIRQVAAIAIFIWATKYIIESNYKKYILFVLLAAVVHNSALVLLFVYPLARYRYSIKEVIIIGIVALMSVVSGVWENCLVTVGTFFNSAYIYYVLDGHGQIPSVGNYMFYIATWIICIIIYYYSNRTRTDYIVFFMSSFCLIMTILFSVAYELLRIRDYFALFYIISITRWIKMYVSSFKAKLVISNIALLLFGIYFFVYLYNWSVNQEAALGNISMSAGNIDYKFNFKLIR